MHPVPTTRTLDSPIEQNNNIVNAVVCALQEVQDKGFASLSVSKMHLILTKV